jgi:hypothetical protein
LWQLRRLPDSNIAGGDVRDEAYGKPIGELKKSDLVPIGVEELPERCRMIHLMRFIPCTRHALYQRHARDCNLEMEYGKKELPLKLRNAPKPRGKQVDGKANRNHLVWSKTDVKQWWEAK